MKKIYLVTQTKADPGDCIRLNNKRDWNVNVNDIVIETHTVSSTHNIVDYISYNTFDAVVFTTQKEANKYADMLFEMNKHSDNSNKRFMIRH